MGELFPALVYILCFLTSAACAWLLGRSYGRSGVRLLFWSCISFLFLAANNLVLVLDLVGRPDDPRSDEHSDGGAGRALPHPPRRLPPHAPGHLSQEREGLAIEVPRHRLISGVQLGSGYSANVRDQSEGHGDGRVVDLLTRLHGDRRD